MNAGSTGGLDSHLQAAVHELQAMIRQRYPLAVFRVVRSQEDSAIVHLMTEVDVVDIEEVVDLVIDRMLELQEAGLPVYVIPSRPLERILAERQAEAVIARRWSLAHRLS